MTVGRRHFLRMQAGLGVAMAGAADGYSLFPSKAAKAWTKDPPGAGGNVQALMVVTRPAVPNALEQNPAWQQINQQLNVNFQINRPPPADYSAKLATIMAGNDLPDIMCFRYGPTFTPAGLPQFLEKSMADLTPYLGGDAAADYPSPRYPRTRGRTAAAPTTANCTCCPR